jgi:hypothetical protein
VPDYPLAFSDRTGVRSMNRLEPDNCSHCDQGGDEQSKD